MSMLPWTGARRLALATLAAAVLTGGCVTAQTAPAAGLVSAVPASAPSKAPGMSAAPAGDYRLGVADKVRVLVYNEPTLSGEFVVNANGSLSMPLIGDVAAAGRSATDVRQDIQSKLAEGYLRDPKVSMDVLTFRPFYILGEVNKPGEYAYATGLTVLNAVATAEGFTYRADKRRAYVKHAGATHEEGMKLTSDLPVQPGDTIRIGERYF